MICFRIGKSKLSVNNQRMLVQISRVYKSILNDGMLNNFRTPTGKIKIEYKNIPRIICAVSFSHGNDALHVVTIAIARKTANVTRTNNEHESLGKGKKQLTNFLLLHNPTFVACVQIYPYIDDRCRVPFLYMGG